MTDTKVIDFGSQHEVSPDLPIEDAEVIEETPKLRPYIKVYRRDPNVDEEATRDTAEGIQLVLDPNGKMIPEIVESFVLEMNAVKVSDGRTLVLTTRLRNNYIITESFSATCEEEYDQDAFIEICKARTMNKIWDHLIFLWHCATVSSKKVKDECGLDLYNFGDPEVDADSMN